MAKSRKALLFASALIVVLGALTFAALHPKDDLAPFRPYVQSEFDSYIPALNGRELRTRQINLQNLSFMQAKDLLDKIYNKRGTWYWDNGAGVYRNRINPNCVAYIFGRMDTPIWQGQVVLKRPDPKKLIPEWTKPHMGPPYVYFEESDVNVPDMKGRVLARLLGRSVD